MARQDLGGIVNRCALDWWDIERRWQIVDDRIQHGLHTLVLEGRAAYDRENLERDGRLPDAGPDLFVGKSFAFYVLFEQLVVKLGDCFDHLVAIFARFGFEISGNVDGIVLGPQGFIAPDERLHFDQVDHAFELILGAHRNLDGHRAAAQPVDDGFH